MTLEEILAIQENNVDLDNDQLMVVGSFPRAIPLSQTVKLLFADLGFSFANPLGVPLTGDELAALLACAVIDAGLHTADEMSADSFRHTYIIYLVKQGIRLSDLELALGYIAPTELSSYSNYSPLGPGRSFEEINLCYPLFSADN